jgi:hypothetical protein
MDQRERRRILGQWGVRPPNVREAAESRKLAAELEVSPGAGRPLRARPRLFKLEADSYIASLGGPLPYMVRLREIDRLTAEAEQELARSWRALAVECDGDGGAFARRWRQRAERRRFDEVNDLIETHNRWYPVEARLPMDPRRRDYVLVGGEPYRRRPLDAAWVLERFPPTLESALAASAA